MNYLDMHTLFNKQKITTMRKYRKHLNKKLHENHEWIMENWEKYTLPNTPKMELFFINL